MERRRDCVKWRLAGGAGATAAQQAASMSFLAKSSPLNSRAARRVLASAESETIPEIELRRVMAPFAEARKRLQSVVCCVPIDRDEPEREPRQGTP